MQEQYCSVRLAQGVGGPGRAECLQSWPLNNALTGELQQGSTIVDGFSKNSASGSTPPQSNPVTCGPQ